MMYARVYYTRLVSKQPWFRELVQTFRHKGLRFHPSSRSTPSNSNAFIGTPVLLCTPQELTGFSRYQLRFALAKEKNQTTLFIANKKDIQTHVVDNMAHVLQFLKGKTGGEVLCKVFSTELWREEVEGKDVAIVGSAESFIGQGLGCEVDKADVVVRLSHAANSKLRDPKEWGERTDVVVLNSASHRKLLSDLSRGLLPSYEGLSTYRIHSFDKFKPVKDFPDIKDPRDPKRMLTTHPLMGTLLTYQTLLCNPKSVTAYAMDFFRTSDPFACARGEPTRIRYNGIRVCHNHAFDEQWFLNNLDNPLLRCDPTLTTILNEIKCT